MQRVMRILPAAVVVFAAGIVPAAAQDTLKVELSGGYQYIHANVEGDGTSLPKGWYADVAGNVSETLGIVFEVGGNYKSESETFVEGAVTATGTADFRVHEFMGGVRLNARANPKVVGFGQVLVGGVHARAKVTGTAIVGGTTITLSEEDSSTDFALQVGGGVNAMFSRTAGVRVGVDYVRVFEQDSGANVFRFVAGIVLTN